MELFRSRGFRDQKPSFGVIFIPLFDTDGLSITEMLQSSKITKQTASIYVRELEKLGYIKKKRNAADKRTINIFLTPKGKKLKSVADVSVAEVNDEFQNRLGTTEFKRLLKILRKYV